MSLPTQPVSVLIVGAGPSGMAAALSLHHQGIKDFVIVDCVLAGQNSSRAVVIQAATLEALDTIGCIDRLLKVGNRTRHIGLYDGSSYLVAADFSLLAPYTKFPFGLVLPQTSTEAVMLETMEERGIHVLRPFKVVSLKSSADKENMIDVKFESGEVVQAKYVIGADGAHSVVRDEAGISFTEPGSDGNEPDLGNLSQLVFGDVTFSTPPQFPDPTFPVFASVSDNNFVLIVPFPAALSHDPTRVEYRVAVSVPVKDGMAPHAPSKEYIQSLLDRCAPRAVNVPRIEETYSTSRYRTRAAVADRAFARLSGGGIVLLVGDAAHIHSPLGGQGMSLGIRDAISLGAALRASLARDEEISAVNELLTDWAKYRRTRALAAVQLTKGAMGVVIAPRTLLRRIGFGLLRFLGRFTFVKRMVAYRLSGLAEV